MGGQLSEHTGRLIGNRQKLGLAGDDLDRSGKLIRSMMNTIRRNKFLLLSVIGLILLVILIILALNLSKDKAS